MTIKRGTDDRLLLAIFLMMALVGCIEATKPLSPKDPPKTPATLSDIAFQSFQARDALRAKKLRAMKGTRYDVKRLAEIERCGADASRETWTPVAEALAKRLDGIPQTDTAAFDAVLEELAIGSEKAGR